MTRIVIMGICGQMGHALYRAAADTEEFTIAAGVDQLADAAFACPVYQCLDDVTEDFDAIIDFSVPAVLENELRYAKQHNKPVVVCTTGLTDEHKAMLQEAASVIPVFNSGNMSIGVNLQMQLLREASAALGNGFDVEIVERHHRKKVDAPSGTALMLANAVNAVREDVLEHKYGRSERNRRRPDNEIGFHSVRGGTIVGEHEVSFIGQDEILEITHKAFSKRVFAEGALRAAAYLCKKENGFYDMEMMLSEQDVQEATPSSLIAEKPIVMLTVAAPYAEAALISETAAILSEASVQAAASVFLPLTDERAEYAMAIASADLGTALAALQPLQAAHETLDIHVQGGAVLLTVSADIPVSTVLPLLSAEKVSPLLCTAAMNSILLCVKNSEKETSITALHKIFNRIA